MAFFINSKQIWHETNWIKDSVYVIASSPQTAVHDSQHTAAVMWNKTFCPIPPLAWWHDANVVLLTQKKAYFFIQVDEEDVLGELDSILSELEGEGVSR